MMIRKVLRTRWAYVVISQPVTHQQMVASGNGYVEQVFTGESAAFDWIERYAEEERSYGVVKRAL